jgi:iron(III) transport system substrate-binding protein
VHAETRAQLFRARGAGLCAALVVLLVACQPGAALAPATSSSPASPAAPPAHSPEVERLLAAVRDNGETRLSLSWGETFGGTAGARRFEALFNRMYGTDVRVEYTPGPSMTDMAGRVTQEVTAGQRASTDLLLGTESHFGTLYNRDVLEPYDYTLLGPRLTSDVVTLGGQGVEVASIVGGIGYNTDLVPRAEAPRVLEDALNPRWKGKIASTQNAGIFDRVTARPEWGPERMKAYVSRLSQQVGGLIRCGEQDRIISGEFSMMVLQCGSYQVRRDTAKGAPVAHVIPEDAATIGYFHFGVPRNAAHPNLAKLFVNVVMSEEGQRLIYEMEYTDNPALPGSRSVEEFADLRAKGIQPLKIDVKFLTENPQIRDLARDLERLLREGN